MCSMFTSPGKSERKDLIVMVDERGDLGGTHCSGLRQALIGLQPAFPKRMLTYQDIFNTKQGERLEIGSQGFLLYLATVLTAQQLEYAVVHKKNTAGHAEGSGGQGNIKCFPCCSAGGGMAADDQQTLHVRFQR